MLRIVSRALLAGLVVAAAACSDRHPAPLPEIPGVEVPPPVHAALRCRMDVRARKLACAPAAPETAPGLSPLIVGGQGTNVLLASTGTSYDSTTQVLRSDVTVQNLMAQALGTTDGAFPAPEGVRVFFHSGPVVTEGTGEVSVANADGEATFTSGAQPYFQYAGMLATGSTSAPREWRFEVPSTVVFFSFTVFVAAPVAGPEAPSAGIVLLAGTDAADSVDAELGTTLRVGVRGVDGKPAVNARVVVVGADLPWPLDREMQVASPFGGGFGWSTLGRTNSRGIVEFRVKMGPRAGPARVIVSVDSLAIADTARYTVLPGRTSQARSLPQDTAVVMGGRAPLRLTAHDRYGNPTGDPVALAAVAGPGTAVGSEVVAGSSIGRVTAVATVAGFSDTSYVTVVPPGTLAGVSAPDHGGQVSTIYMFSPDASDVRPVRPTITVGGYFGTMDVAWLGRTKLVYHENNYDHTKQLYVHDLATGVATRLLAPAGRMAMENIPRGARDGSWAYFSGGTYDRYYLYRVRADGTGMERLSSDTPAARNEWGAEPSPDGTRIAFVKDGAVAVNEIHVMDLATREVRPLGLNGRPPRWSPDGSRIAVMAWTPGEPERLTLVSPDGSGVQPLATANQFLNIDWSPDGRYIVSAISGNRLAILEVATGTEVVVPVPGIDGTLISAVWQP
ncbi:MAG TPA: hypothetical protein VFR81_16575 [Longimicrobium sp.]|nr:hypothetical protein [Longimicrobium sp.]